MSRKSLLLFITLLCCAMSAEAQVNDEALFRSFNWRGIGPSVMAGRVSDVEALDSDFRTVLVASASGGVFKSTNAGITWETIFDKYGSSSIGDVAFFQPNPDIIWVGTGEANNRNSSGWGDGIYKSTDGGKTFTNMGLGNTHQIARIITHPSNPDIVWVAAIGHLWGYSGDRGVFKTTDGGTSWIKLTNGLPIDGKTGSTDLIINPDNPEILFTAMYERIRRPWSFKSGGPNSGIFKTTNGGESWTKITNGLPSSDIGRIGLAVYRKDPNIVMAIIEVDENLPDDLSIPGPGVYRSEDGGETWKYLYRHSSRPFYFGQIRINPNDDNLVYLLYRSFEISKDGGKTFGQPFRGVYGDPHGMWIDPNGGKNMYFADDGGAHLSHDTGKSWIKFDNLALGQYYAIGVDMREPYHIYGGLQDQNVWGIPSNSRDNMGILNEHTVNVSGGDGFHAQVDPTDWRMVYSVAHVGYLGRSNMETRERKFITPMPETIENFAEFAKADYDEKPIKYTIDPGEDWLWRDIPSRSINGNIMPAHFRYNWSTPLVMSPSDPQTIYFGSNYLFKSINKGETWRIISPDLTTNDPAKRNPSNDGGLTVDVTGAENHCTIITISESSVDKNVVWVGTDDGNVQVTLDGGSTWKNVRGNVKGVPEFTWTSRVEASHFERGTAYASFDGHRDDNFKAYIYKTIDFGETWRSIGDDIPGENSVYVVKEDYKNNNLLFAGTEFGVFATINRGDSWFKLTNKFPTVAVHDLVIHPREADLIAGTHGRSIYIMDDITPLQQLTPDVLAKDIYLFEQRHVTNWQSIARGGHRGMDLFRGENPPRGAFVHFYTKNVPSDEVKITISNEDGSLSHSFTHEAEAGINAARWNMMFMPGKSDIDAFKGMLFGVLNVLLPKVTTDEKKVLSEIINKINFAEQPNELNGIRNDFIENFRMYQQFGEPLFGETLGRKIAPAGTYKITLTIGETTLTGELIVRDDPILRK